MEAVSAKANAIVVDPLLAKQSSFAESGTRRRQSRRESTAIYDSLSAAYHHYTHSFPEDSFPTFLESQLLDELAADSMPTPPAAAPPSPASRATRSTGPLRFAKYINVADHADQVRS